MRRPLLAGRGRIVSEITRMTRRMLIDATHPEETRVVVLNGNRLEEFDFESSTKKQLKGNIYLAKVTRVEPSLQAAFVEFGGNRHGFLAFSEIHPDYYQIPIADRMALLKEEAEEFAEESEIAIDGAAASVADGGTGPDDGQDAGAAAGEDADVATDAAPVSEDDAPGADAVPEAPSPMVEEFGDEDDAEIHAAQRRRVQPKRQRYKIQEVIKRRQILLVQVVKEERGNKGAALTTYLSLAGRYCVLMPNTSRGGGISRKISSPSDRKRLKGLLSELDIPEGMAVILRTAAIERSKAELKRDFEYLMRAWDQVRELTLKSIAPTLVYEEANLIKRSIRDLYAKDIDEVLVEGDEGYRTAKEFMRMLMPSHAKKVQPYKDPEIPLFHRYQVESQFDAMHSPQVQLKSGGYIVINATEALVAIDVNSGRSTRERNIEETAYKTNLEAAEEIARQLRLRDLAGLIVIDFIDMGDSRNQHTVERRLKEAMRTDRARIQIGRISAFGLLELSRQRLRPSLLEASSQTCPHCAGTGVVRSVESAALHVLRAIEEEGIRHRSLEINVTVPVKVALYVLNQKRARLAEIEARYGLRVMISGDDTLVPPNFRLERVVETPAEQRGPAEDRAEVRVDSATAAGTEEERGHRRRRRRRGRRGEDSHAEDAGQREGEESIEAEEEAATAEAVESEAPGAAQDDKLGRRRRGRRGGRRRGRHPREEPEGVAETAAGDAGPASEGEETVLPPEQAAEGRSPPAAKPKRRGRRRSRKSDAGAEAAPPEAVSAPEVDEAGVDESEAAPVPEDAAPEAATIAPTGNGPNGGGEPAEPPSPADRVPAGAEVTDRAGDAPKRRGWWNRFTQ
jgi:ribonuclease E